jgi:hypothetical protein
VQQWLALETQRRPFKVSGIEQNFELDLGGSTFSLKIDRVDQVDDHEVIIDYKSNSNTVGGALSEPISDPLTHCFLAKWLAFILPPSKIKKSM